MRQSVLSKLLIASIALLLCVAIGFGIWNMLRFRVTGTVPNMKGTVPTATSVVKIKFSKALDTSREIARGEITDPQAIVHEVSIEDKALLFRLDDLQEGVQYTIGLNYIQSKSGQRIDNIQFTFVPRYVAPDDMSPEQQELELQETDRNNLEDPIMKYLPHSTLNYTLHPAHEADEEGGYVFVVDAKILLSAAEVRIDRLGTVELRKKEIQDYIRSLGLDPANYVIRYNVVESS